MGAMAPMFTTRLWRPPVWMKVWTPGNRPARAWRTRLASSSVLPPPGGGHEADAHLAGTGSGVGTEGRTGRGHARDGDDRAEVFRGDDPPDDGGDLLDDGVGGEHRGSLRGLDGDGELALVGGR